jgi:hypothetical protein
MNMQDVKLIRLPNGSTLEVSIFPGFLEKVRDHFSLKSSSDVEDDHIRMYIYGVFKTAVDKTEKPEDVHTSA